MDKLVAEKAKSKALIAIRHLHSILEDSSEWDSDSMRKLKRGIGLSIGIIEVDLLRVIYGEYPDLDDIR
jgi:hypothetical protein